jgi:hypothetical protein
MVVSDDRASQSSRRKLPRKASTYTLAILRTRAAHCTAETTTSVEEQVSRISRDDVDDKVAVISSMLGASSDWSAVLTHRVRLSVQQGQVWAKGISDVIHLRSSCKLSWRTRPIPIQVNRKLSKTTARTSLKAFAQMLQRYVYCLESETSPSPLAQW